MPLLLRRTMLDHLHCSRPQKILSASQRMRLRFFRACGLASGPASCASSQTAMSDSLLACRVFLRGAAGDSLPLSPSSLSFHFLDLRQIILPERHPPDPLLSILRQTVSTIAKIWTSTKQTDRS